MTKAKSRSSAKKAQKKSNSNLLIGGAAAVVVIAILAIAALSGGGGSSTAEAVSIADLSGVITPNQYEQVFIDQNTDHFLLDVRTPGEFAPEHIANASNIAVEELASRISEVPTNQPIVVYCNSGRRSAIAVDILREAGYTQVYDLGGIQNWKAAGYPVE